MKLEEMKKLVYNLRQIQKDEREKLDAHYLNKFIEAELLITNLIGERTKKPKCDRRIGINYCPEFGNLCTNIKCDGIINK